MARIAWLIPSLLEGSGGHRTFLQHADALQRRGHRCALYVENPEGASSASLIRDIQQYFGFEFEEVHAGWHEIQPADMVFATIWYSARVVRDLRFPCIKAYFVQDFEALFNPMGDGYLLAENSYRYGLHPITIGRWLPALLSRQFGVQARYFDFCADLSIYRRLDDVPREKSVCFIYQPDKPRRCPELGIEALSIVKHYMPDVTIYLYGAKSSGRVWFEHKHLGLLSLEECNHLYNRCAVGLCISSSNPSRIPFEMMAAGLPVVEIHRENTVYDFPESAMLLCEQTPESIADGILTILGDPERQNNMGRAGQDFMRNRSIDAGLAQFGGAVQDLLQNLSSVPDQAEPIYRLAPHTTQQAPLRTIGSEVHGSALADRGRLARLPPPLRKLARFCYYRLRKLWT